MNFLDRFSFKNSNKISQKSIRWEPSCSMVKDRQTDRQTDMMKANSGFYAILQTHLKNGGNGTTFK